MTLSATVTPSNAVGTVQFKDNGTNVGSPVPVSNGAATMQYVFTTAGNRNITATFTSVPASRRRRRRPSPWPSVLPPCRRRSRCRCLPPPKPGTAVTLTANLTPVDASGKVQFKDGNADIGSLVTGRTGRRSSVTPSPTPGNTPSPPSSPVTRASSDRRRQRNR
ncbi:hypothetical protein GS891_00370 [Rhodococcus hoagii]|nr:hypothetical protein [Prescottella equi]